MARLLPEAGSGNSERAKRGKLLFAVDPSLTASGWALFCLLEDRPLAVGVISPPGPKLSMPQRLEFLQREIVRTLKHFSLAHGDILICEGPAPLVLNPNSSMKVERVRGIFETVAREHRLHVPGRINPRTVQVELLGMRGKQLPRKEVKAWASEAVDKLYGKQLAKLPIYGVRKRAQRLPQDVVDALLIGALAVSRVRMSHSTKVELESMFEPRGGRTNGRANYRQANWTSEDLKKRST